MRINKKTRNLLIFLTSFIVVGLVSLLTVYSVSADSLEKGRPGDNPGGGGQGRGRGSGGGQTTPLSEAEASALLEAVEEEYGAAALYKSVIDTYGEVYPFSGIYQSELNHAGALVRQAEKYGIEVPQYSFTDLPVFDSLEAACAAGVQAEIADAALYDSLMAVTEHTDLIRVYENLQRASLESHLPRFESCQ